MEQMKRQMGLQVQGLTALLLQPPMKVTPLQLLLLVPLQSKILARMSQ